jgi:flagellar biosynthesis/type III secretory pathway protein FliH
MRLDKMNKTQLIERCKKLEREIERLEEQREYLYDDDQLNERYDEGYDHGFNQGREERCNELTDYDLTFYDNVLRFG